MNRQRESYRQVGLLSLVGLGLLGCAFFAPDAGRHAGLFFSVAMQTTWQNPLDWPAAWCSVKIILWSFGLFLLIESTGTLLTVRKHKSLAGPVFFLQVVPCLGLGLGGFYLVKALL
jgi:hypothetical protein